MNSIFILLPGSCPGWDLGVLGESKTSAGGFEMVPHRLRALVSYVSCLFLLFYLVCSLKPCDPLLRKRWLLPLLCVVSSCVYFFTYPYGVPGQKRYLIVSVPGLYLPYSFKNRMVCFSTRVQWRNISLNNLF